MKELYVNIALNIPIDKLFTYRVPEYLADEVEPGKRVLVSFGRKSLTGLIMEVKGKTELERVKSIKSLLDEERCISDELMNFCKWAADYYVTPLGEVLFSAIPSNINIQSELYYSLTEDYIKNYDKSKKENELFTEVLKIFETSSVPRLTKGQIENRLKTDDASGILKKMTDEEILKRESFYSKPTAEKIIKIIRRNYEADELPQLMKDCKVKAVKQTELLNLLLEKDEFEMGEVNKRVGITPSSLNTLVGKELVSMREERQMRTVQEIYTEKHKSVKLNEEQEVCVDRIWEAVNKGEFKTFLIHGITGSGKTEVYINVIDKVLMKGKSAIVLVPEISLTPQVIHRFRRKFGDIVGVIHSRLSDGERLDTYDRIQDGTYRIVIGARSALFAPVKDIGMIVVDEEHDPSYKQENPPRYQGRDCAIVRGLMNDGVVILGSATPSIESYYNAKSGKYELLELTHRATKINPPEIKIIDLRKRDKERLQEYLESATNKVKKDFFDFIDKVRVKFLSKDIILAIDDKLEKKESIILLQNRRGFHSYIECLSCGEVEMCPRCDIALTYHKAFGQLKCHYCGYSRRMTSNCSNCNSDRLVPMGAGTEKVEEELVKLFPSSVIRRMDSDTLTSKTLYQEILRDFYDKKIDILVGTQVISKGLDFPDVTLVGVVNADIGLLNPDFRATERTFQILTQVAGRSGRSEKPGEVYIQTNHPDYFVFDNVQGHDYDAFYKNELAGRQAVNYPPYSRLALIETKCEERNLAEGKIKEIFNFIKTRDKERKLDVLPPNPPLFSKLRDKYRYHLLIKSPKSKDPSGKYLNGILKGVREYAEENIPHKVQVIIDMDVVNLL